MAAVGGGATLTVVVVSGVGEVEGAAVGGTAVAGVVVDGVSIVGVVLAPADSASDAELGALCVAVAPPSAGARSAFVTCGRNGSFVWKTSNETSWPPSVAAGGTSVSASSPAGVAPVAAVV